MHLSSVAVSGTNGTHTQNKSPNSWINPVASMGEEVVFTGQNFVPMFGQKTISNLWGCFFVNWSTLESWRQSSWRLSFFLLSYELSWKWNSENNIHTSSKGCQLNPMVNWHSLGAIWHPLEGPGMYINWLTSLVCFHLQSKQKHHFLSTQK